MQQPIATSGIVQRAFSAIELQPPSSFADDSDQARDAAAAYASALRIALEFADWRFASVLAELPEAEPAAGVVADPDLGHAYVIPSDMVALREVFDPAARWRLDRDFLRASVAGPLRVRYTAMIDREGHLPATFAEAVALQLALQLAPRWLTTMAKHDRLRGDADRALKAAARQDARQASAVRMDGRPRQPDWATEAPR